MQKKNQHYVPQFYLRHFAITEGRTAKAAKRKLIRTFNIPNEKFIEYASIKNQASDSFYYGEDLEIENKLSKMEGVFANTLWQIVNGDLPKRVTSDTIVTENTFSLSEEYSSLLYFISVMDFRNPTRKKQIEVMTDNLAKQMLKISKEFGNKMDIVNQFEIVPKDSVREALSHVELTTELMADLNYKLLVNHTSIPFVTSDYPVARYNQWLEQKTNRPASGGYGSLGVQLFIPISDRLQLLVYDDAAYNVGKPRHTVVNMIRKNDVDQINLLQYLNALSNVYGNDRMTEDYVRDLASRAKKFPSPNQITQKEIGSFVFQNTSGMRTRLNLSFVNLTPYALEYPVGNQAVFLREYAAMIREKRRWLIYR